MNISKTLSYVMILIGAMVAIYAKAQVNQNEYILIGGIVLLMVGVYRISRNISSKSERENDNESQ
ncbi:hypothetical protein ESY86_00820 [Subsaximicrobium wynnwilliamsii]|uniref:Uncharacterized protein n=1 Tax=Subsaximicrobium wynnwilliamsii TaxID=291179 RepID=A0A5C6ZQG0_9FLAO|nr:hypothetical protein [Subsaximicrobium wynnwilliamsii]TXD85120.1 hypothetical protein ESY87_01990 [Subsaximicrobium wynnwilliamsii]TXD91163.1 hypothetical protein ESY86_00820 [Subsaximicrobium wynnwilliamsii]TXE04557.1 hypothetical protein ESY88_03470 [Subsaximicrobium wynnwilliamsii]